MQTENFVDPTELRDQCAHREIRNYAVAHADGTYSGEYACVACKQAFIPDASPQAYRKLREDTVKAEHLGKQLLVENEMLRKRMETACEAVRLILEASSKARWSDV